MKKYYYKSKKGNRVLCLEHPLESSKLAFFEEITKAQYDALLQKKENKRTVARLKRLLRDTDYCVIKIAEGAATTEEYAEVISQRATWRARINELEELL